MTRHPLTQRMVRVGLALALLASVTVYSLASARPASAATSQQVGIGLTAMSPKVATSSSDTIDLSGQLTVPSGHSHQDVIVQLAYTAIGLRSDMSQAPGTGDEQQLNSKQDPLGTIAAGSHPWSLQIPVSYLGAVPGTVYALDVEAWSDGELLGAMRTYLPYEIGDGDSVAPTSLTVLAPVAAPTALDGYQQVSGGPYPEMTGDALAGQMGQNGSLYKLLAAGAQLAPGTVSWVLDPDLIETASAIQDGYVVASRAGAADTPGPSAGNAGNWLKEAKTVLGASGTEVWQLPSTDPDLGSLANASTTEAQQLVSAAAQQATTGNAVKSALSVDPRGLIAWPAGGQVTGQTLKLAQSVDPAAVVADSQSIGQAVPDDAYTPTGRATVDGKTNLVVADDALDSIMSGDPADAAYTSSGSDSTVLASQRLLAETALIALQEPNVGRSVMVALPRSAQAATADMTVLGALKGASWVKPAGLSTLLKQSADPAASTRTPTRAASATGTDLTGSQLSRVLSLDSELGVFQSILSKGSTAEGFDEAVLRTVSTSWRGDEPGWTAFSSSVANRLQMQINDVYLIPKSDLTLSGTSGAIPFTVVNKLPEPVELGLKIVTNRTGLTVTQVPARSFRTGTTTVEVKVTDSAPGANVQVTAYLVDSNGRDYGSVESGGSRSLQVRVTAYGFVALLLFAGSAALLVFAVGLRIYRGRRASRGGPETHAGD